MAPRDFQSSYEHDRLRAARLADEWANVGLCGGMFRPVNGGAPAPGEAPREQLPVAGVSAQGRNQRCCR